MEEAIKKVNSMTEKQLQATWEALRNYDPGEFWDAQKTVSMDDWAQLIYAQMDILGIPHF